VNFDWVYQFFRFRLSNHLDDPDIDEHHLDDPDIDEPFEAPKGNVLSGEPSETVGEFLCYN